MKIIKNYEKCPYHIPKAQVYSLKLTNIQFIISFNKKAALSHVWIQVIFDVFARNNNNIIIHFLMIN